MEWVVRAPILTVVVGLFAPGINPMPENVPIDKRQSSICSYFFYFAEDFSSKNNGFSKALSRVGLENKFHIGIVKVTRKFQVSSYVLF